MSVYVDILERLEDLLDIPKAQVSPAVRQDRIETEIKRLQMVEAYHIEHILEDGLENPLSQDEALPLIAKVLSELGLDPEIAQQILDAREA